MRTYKTFTKAFFATLAGGITLFVGAAQVSAHASIPTDDLVAGGYGQLSIRIPHGCDGAATNIVEVQIPDGFSSIKPQAKAGWEVEVEMVDLAEPIENHGNIITDRVGVIRWTGGNLADNQYDEFGITVKAPDAPGTSAGFPTIQYCGDDASVAWIGEDTPTIDIVAGPTGHGAEDSHGTEDDHSMTSATETMDPAVLASAVSEAVASATADQAVVIEALQAQVVQAAADAAAANDALAAVEDGEDDGSTSPLAVIALIAGIAGLGVAAVALRKS